MTEQSILITIGVVSIIFVIVIFVLIKRHKSKTIRTTLDNLEREKNIVASTPVMTELSKIEALIKNDLMEEKYNVWKQRFYIIKDERIAKVTDMLIELELYADKKDYKGYKYSLAKTEMELYKVKTSADKLLDEIKEITLSEEKYRNIVTKLKSKYRELIGRFQDKKSEYDSLQETIELQFENIEKRFLDFETTMEKSEYSEIVHIVKAIDAMIEHMHVVIEETPDLFLLANKMIPKRIEQVREASVELIEHGYSIDYLNIDYNIEETNKNINGILDRIKVLNLENCMFELKTILDYLDSLFNDFEKERLSRKVYEEIVSDFEKKFKKISKLIKGIYNQMDDIKDMYKLTDKDLVSLDDLNKKLTVINDEYKIVVKQVVDKAAPYSNSHKEIELLSVKLRELEEELDVALKSLGSMYDDELRAREQLDEIQDFLKQCKSKIRTYKLPIITDNYFVELREANEAILEIIRELEKKPIVIKVLNVRVDTARDLVLKLFNTTNEMIRCAQNVEDVIVYGNRYRMMSSRVESGLNEAKNMFFKGNYKEALDLAITIIGEVEPGFDGKVRV